MKEDKDSKSEEKDSEAEDKPAQAIIEVFDSFGEDRLGIRQYRGGLIRPAKTPEEKKEKRSDDTI